jgi:hypothetical protein
MNVFNDKDAKVIDIDSYKDIELVKGIIWEYILLLQTIQK